MKSKDERHRIQVFYDPHGMRAVVFSDIIALLYERGHKTLAQELTKRCNLSFKKLDKKTSVKKEFMSGSAIWEKTDKNLLLETELEKPITFWWKFWK